jgi:hypothetical protein
MSFVPTNNGNMGGMPDISARMKPVGSMGHYESQGMDRAVTIGQDGRPMGRVEEVPPFDLLTEDNKHIIEQRKRQKEAQRRKRLQENTNQNKSKAPADNANIIDSVKKELVGKNFKYITKEKFGNIVEVVDCRMVNEEIEIIMNDGFSIQIADLESQFVTYYDVEENFVEQEPVIEAPRVEAIPKVSAPKVNLPSSQNNSNLPSSPLRDLLSSRKKNPTSISIEIDIDLVKKDFYNIIDESYDNAIDYVIEHVMNNLTIDQVKDSIKKKLIMYYKSEQNSVINEEFENKEIYKEPETIILEKSQ